MKRSFSSLKLFCLINNPFTNISNWKSISVVRCLYVCIIVIKCIYIRLFCVLYFRIVCVSVLKLFLHFWTVWSIYILFKWLNFCSQRYTHTRIQATAPQIDLSRFGVRYFIYNLFIFSSFLSAHFDANFFRFVETKSIHIL